MNAWVELSPQVSSPNLVYQAFVGVRQAQPHLGLKGWSRLLATSEGELQASRLGQEDVRSLADTFSLLYQLAGLGELEICTFNDAGWAKYRGRFAPPDLCLENPHYLGLEFRANHLRLQLNMDQWYWGCAVEDRPSGGRVQKSLQFFTGSGDRFLKIQATANTSQVAWKKLLFSFAGQQEASKPLFAPQNKPLNKTLASDDLLAFARDWRWMTSPNQLPLLLSRYQTSYLAALQQLKEKFAREVSLNALSEVLRQVGSLPASESKPELELSVYSEGCLQRMHGILQAPRLQHKDLCIAYAEGCIHLDPQMLEEAWVVRKPQGDQWITSLEVFDPKGQQVLQLQEYKPAAHPENLLLRQIFHTLS